MNERPTKRPGPLLWLASRTWRFWIIGAIAAPVLYIAPVGPLMWLYAHHAVPAWANPLIEAIYWPVLWIDSPDLLRAAIRWYAKLWGWTGRG